MTQHISPTDLKLIDTAPRVLDLTLAGALGFAQERDIRKLVKRNSNELSQHGEVCAMVAQTSELGGRPTEEYWLNEPQSLLICMFARTDNAAEVRKEIIRVFMDWRAKQPRAPSPDPQIDIPGEDVPLNQYMAKIATLRECRLIHGTRAAARLWQRLGMPVVTDSLIQEMDEGRRCLAHLLAVRSNIDFRPGDYESEVTLRDDLDMALDGNEDAQAALASDWLLLAVSGVNDGLFVPNCSVKAFHNSAWSQGRHVQALRTLPGSLPMKRSVFGQQCRGTFIPAALIESTPLPAQH